MQHAVSLNRCPKIFAQGALDLLAEEENEARWGTEGTDFQPALMCQFSKAKRPTVLNRVLRPVTNSDDDLCFCTSNECNICHFETNCHHISGNEFYRFSSWLSLSEGYYLIRSEEDSVRYLPCLRLRLALPQSHMRNTDHSAQAWSNYSTSVKYDITHECVSTKPYFAFFFPLVFGWVSLVRDHMKSKSLGFEKYRILSWYNLIIPLGSFFWPHLSSYKLELFDFCISSTFPLLSPFCHDTYPPIVRPSRSEVSDRRAAFPGCKHRNLYLDL